MDLIRVLRVLQFLEQHITNKDATQAGNDMAQALMCFATYDEASAQRHSRQKLPRHSQVGALAWRARHCLSVSLRVQVPKSIYLPKTNTTITITQIPSTKFLGTWTLRVYVVWKPGQFLNQDFVAAATGTVMPRQASLQAEGSKPNHLYVLRLGCVCLFGSYGVNITYFGTHGACQARCILARYLV